MAAERKSSRVPKRLRDLSDQELNKITKAVGEQVRAQTVAQKEKLRTSLRREIDAARAAFLSHGKKGSTERNDSR